ncbi:MAG: class I SAM-dependent methyltransferase [Phycisphaerales bacterium]|nr:class I SAM-dependent methyltransferase [Phycisphaerales bacterium]
MNIADWLDGGDPHDAARSSAQSAWLQAWAESAPRRVLDLGCGTGRALIPLAKAGHDVVGFDRNAAALEICRADLGGATARLCDVDFTSPWPDCGGPFDAVICLGNTLMLVPDLDAAAALLRQCAHALVDGGMLVIDDIPSEFLPEVAAGNWVDGVSDDGKLQMIWEADDDVFTIRSGSSVDESNWSLTSDDVRLRLWTDERLSEVASAAGLSGPFRPETGPGVGTVLIMRSVQVS